LLQIEVEPLGVLFTAENAQTGTYLWLNGMTGVLCAPDLSANTLYHWRVRWLYNSVTTPFQQHSRWFTMPWNG